MDDMIGMALILAMLMGIYALILGLWGGKSKSLPSWATASEAGSAEVVLEGLLGVVALSQVLARNQLNMGHDVAAGLLALAVAIAIRIRVARPPVRVAMEALGFLAALGAAKTFVSPEPLCGITMSNSQRWLLLLGMVVAFCGSLLLTLAMAAFRGRLIEQLTSTGLGLFGAVEFVVLLASLVPLNSNSGMSFLVSLVLTVLVGALTGLFAELTIWVMGVAGAVYSLVGGTLFNYSAEPRVRACLGEQSNPFVLGVFLVVLLALGLLFVRIRPFKR